MEDQTPTDTNALMHVSQRPPLVMARGAGSYLWDEDGNRYLDFVQGWAVNALGHSPRVVVEALASRAATLMNPGPAFHHRPQLDLARSMVARGALDRVFFCSSGAEANEGAIKLARRFAGKRRPGAFEIVTTDGGFHGRTLATMAASGKPGWDRLFPPTVPGFAKVQFGSIDALAAAIGERTAAVMLEPIQGEAGVIVPPDGYLREVRALTAERGVLLILDEVQTGVGRTGTLFRFEAEGIVPDILTLGKGLGGGVPLAALCAREEVSCFEPGDQGGTYSGNALMMAAGSAVLETVAEPSFLEGVRSRGAALRRGLEAIATNRGILEVRGAGLLLAARLGSEIAAGVVDHCREAGLLLNAPRPNVLRFMPALDVDPSQIDDALDILDEALARALRSTSDSGSTT